MGGGLLSTLHIYLDEAGDWEFSPKGSRFIAMGALWTFAPSPLAGALTTLRFELLREGLDIESFHASPDRQSTRNKVVAALRSCPDWNFSSALMEKRKVNPSIRDPHRLYPTMARPLLRLALRSVPNAEISRVLVFSDTINVHTKAKREGVLKAIKSTCAAELRHSQPHFAFSHARQSNALLQAADYCLWSVYRKWAGGDSRTYEQLRDRLTREICITDSGDGTVYF